LTRYLEKFPGVKVIIDHCGMPPSKLMRSAIAHMEGLPDSAEYWARVGDKPLMDSLDDVLRMADWPNVALKWAHAAAIFEAPDYPNEALRPILRKALDAFGAERVMWASDKSANQTGETWAELLFSLRNNPDLSDKERDYLLGRTARIWLNWAEGPGAQERGRGSGA
jgi:predicted TIM-barrel fold metal-dependent hydrolase